ncbi:hypothetical protein BJ741DRAFT_587050 [Chytriomyces cf. hyalinus JEL632]|nr:hypothetical protein BJ741DRAFT_587050 [Chytriomyces cf. hyalinus JEL632]
MGNTASLTANIHAFFTLIVSGRSLYVGSAFSIFLASIIAPFLADTILGTTAVALSRKGFVHVAFLANVGPISIVKDLFRVTPEARNSKHYGVGCSVFTLAIFIAAVPAVIHQILVPTSNPPIATVWPLNANSGELAFSERFGKRRAKVEWCVPKDGPTQTVASSLGSVVSKFSANPNCKEDLNAQLTFPTIQHIVTPANLLAGIQSSTMTRLSRVGGSGGAILGIDVPLSRKTDIKYAIARYYEGFSGLSPANSTIKSCDAAVTTVVTITKTNKTPTSALIDCTAYGVDMHDQQDWEFIMCYDHGDEGAFTGNRTVAIFVSTTAQATSSSWDFVYHAYMPTTQSFELLTDWNAKNYTVRPNAARTTQPMNMTQMRLVEARVDNITIQEFVGPRDCRALKTNDSAAVFMNDGTADQYILGAWQQSGNIVHLSFSQYEATARDKILIEFTGWQGIVFVSLFVVALVVSYVLQPSMRNLQLQISCGNSLALTSARPKPWYTKTGFFLRKNAQGDTYISCEESYDSIKPLMFKEAVKSCKESDKLSGYGPSSGVKGSQPYHSL